MQRRSFLAAGVAGAALSAVSPASGSAASPMLKPDAERDQSSALRRAAEAAASAGEVLQLGPGTYRLADVALPSGTRLVGVPGLTVLLAARPAAILRARDASRLSLTGLSLMAGGEPFEAADALLHCEGVDELIVKDCTFRDAPCRGIHLEGCGGRIEACHTEEVDTALYANDSTGLVIFANRVRGCANNGILVHRSKKGPDGTLVTANRIEAIAAKGGGLGWNGNAINVFRAGRVTVSENVLSDCAFSFVRANAGDAVAILGNNCEGAGEVGIYCEFSFEGAVIANNLVERAATGISVVNFDKGGRLASVQANVVRNCFERPLLDREGEGYGHGIAIEADTAATGNVVEACAQAGFRLGYGNYLRDVALTGNVVRSCAAGVVVTVAQSERNVLISGNLFSGCLGGTVIGYEWERKATADLARAGRRPFPG
jgi:uncharacterized secreted repeat protein (TIGR03808 family)